MAGCQMGGLSGVSALDGADVATVPRSSVTLRVLRQSCCHLKPCSLKLCRNWRHVLAAVKSSRMGFVARQ
eukprot:3297421-Amphidinium_carterae.1